MRTSNDVVFLGTNDLTNYIEKLKPSSYNIKGWNQIKHKWTKNNTDQLMKKPEANHYTNLRGRPIHIP